MDNRKSEIEFSPLTQDDGPEVIGIFNHYIMHSDAAFPDHPVPESFYEHMLSLSVSYPSVGARDETGRLIGFGMLRPHNPMPAFCHTAELTYFIRPDRTGSGIGTQMLGYLEREGQKIPVYVLLAQISSKNEGSIRFHRKNGFTECGRFAKVGIKRGEYFDTVWMQKELSPVESFTPGLSD